MRQNRASRTAQQNALFRALEARRSPVERIANDTLAVRFLPVGFRLLAGLARVPLVRRGIETLTDRRWPGPRAGQLVRTAFIDEAVQEAAGAVEQAVVLGAGLDTRAYRLRELAALRVFEVDHPSTQAIKRRIVARVARDRARHVAFVPVDFSRDDLKESLSRAGFASGGRTLVIWEGVTNYLTDASVDETFRSIACLVGTGSPVLFTYVDRAILDGSRNFEGAAESSRAVRKVGEPYTFGFEPEEVSSYLAARGFDLLSDSPVSELADRYYGGRKRPKVYAYYHVVQARRS